MSDELKACPFCGSSDIVVSTHSQDMVWARCVKCGTYGRVKSKHDIEAAKVAWNNRPIEDALRAELAAANARLAKAESELAISSIGYRYADIVCKLRRGRLNAALQTYGNMHMVRAYGSDKYDFSDEELDALEAWMAWREESKNE